MVPDFDVLVTAEEAWPAFERAVLGARREILAGFRIFDLCTPLIGPEAREIGETWFDLLAHVVARGVDFRLTVSDFDPVMAADLHELTWITVRQGAALAEITRGPGAGRVEVHAALHPARAGLLPRLAFLPAVMLRKSRLRRALNGARLERQAVGLKSGDLPRMHPVSHHQKLAVIDGEVLYVGGLDLNRRRFDTRDHDRPAHLTWSDVQLILRGGPEPAEARRHLLTFVDASHRRAPVPECPHLKRTFSVPRRIQFPFVSPNTLLSEIEGAHIDAFNSARHLIHIETQYLRSSRIAGALAKAAEKNRDLHAVIVMPALPDDMAFEGARGIDVRYGLALERRAVTRLRAGFGKRLTIAAPVRPVMAARDAPSVLCGSPVVHVHNKVLVRDDDYAMIGSANLNGRSMRWDTEVAVEVTGAARMALLRDKLFAHWWCEDLPPEARDPARLQPWWAAEIARNALRLPENRRGFLVPFDAGKGAALAQDLPGATEDIV